MARTSNLIDRPEPQESKIQDAPMSFDAEDGDIILRSCDVLKNPSLD